MGVLPKVLLALMLLLPGGFVLAPAMLLLKRWRARRASEHAPQLAQPVLAPQLPAEPKIAA